jgi:hypothetical protein
VCRRRALRPRRRRYTQLFDWQRDIVRWGLELGRASLFEECGLGKTFQQLEWGRQVADHTRGRVLIVAPLAVAHQTVKRSHQARSRCSLCAQPGGRDEGASTPLLITNYDMIKAFDPRAFAGVVLDESSILKAFSGATKKRLIAMFQRTPYRLACTATPSPNDVVELGNHAEFLGVMDSHEMLARWFINDQGKAGHYRLKGHASKRLTGAGSPAGPCVSRNRATWARSTTMPALCCRRSRSASTAFKSTTPAHRPTAGCSSTTP